MLNKQNRKKIHAKNLMEMNFNIKSYRQKMVKFWQIDKYIKVKQIY